MYAYFDGKEWVNVTVQQIRDLAANGVITPETMIRFPDGREAPANKINDLVFSKSEPTAQNPFESTESFQESSGDESEWKLGDFVKRVSDDIGLKPGDFIKGFTGIAMLSVCIIMLMMQPPGSQQGAWRLSAIVVLFIIFCLGSIACRLSQIYAVIQKILFYTREK